MVLTLGAVRFDPFFAVEHGRIQNYDELKQQGVFYIAFEIEEQVQDGRTIGDDTLAWWSNQSPYARASAFNPLPSVKRSVAHGLADFEEWLKTLGRRPILWAWPAVFDLGILDSLYAEYLPALVPGQLNGAGVHYNDKKDLGTLAWALDLPDMDCIEFEGQPHHALDDAIHQAKEAQHLKQLFKSA